MKRLVSAIALLALVVGAGQLRIDEAMAHDGRIGVFAPAEVICDPLAQTMTLRPHFGASRALSSQWLTYRYYILNIDTGRGYWTGFPKAFSHSAVYVTGAITEFRDWAYVPDWTIRPGAARFKVYTQYAWYDRGHWTYRGAWTTGYQGVYFDGGGAFCRTSSVAG